MYYHDTVHWEGRILITWCCVNQSHSRSSTCLAARQTAHFRDRTSQWNACNFPAPNQMPLFSSPDRVLFDHVAPIVPIGSQIVVGRLQVGLVNCFTWKSSNPAEQLPPHLKWDVNKTFMFVFYTGCRREAVSDRTSQLVYNCDCVKILSGDSAIEWSYSDRDLLVRCGMP